MIPPAEGGARRGTYLTAQVLVRVVLALVTYTVFVGTGALASDGVVAQRGTAQAVDCERVGPISRSGLGWYWSCDAEITWADGSTGRSSFQASDLTPESRTEPVPVVRKEVRNRGDMVDVDKQRPLAGLGWALYIPLLGTTLAGFRVPGVPRRSAHQRVRDRERRLQWWQPLALPIGWGLVFAGGFARADQAFRSWSVFTIVLGYAALAAGWFIWVYRRRDQQPAPPQPSPQQLTTVSTWGRRVCWVGGALALVGLIAGMSSWPGVIGLLAVPACVVVVGTRLVVVARRHTSKLQNIA